MGDRLSVKIKAVLILKLQKHIITPESSDSEKIKELNDKLEKLENTLKYSGRIYFDPVDADGRMQTVRYTSFCDDTAVAEHVCR